MRLSTSVSRLTKDEYDSTMQSISALLDRMNRIRRNLNDQTEARHQIEDMMQNLTWIQGQVVRLHRSMEGVDV